MQTDLFPDQNRRVEPHEAAALFAELLAAVAAMNFATDLARGIKSKP